MRVTLAHTALACLVAWGLPQASAQVAQPPAWSADVDAQFADYDTPDSPGCAVGIYRAGHVEYARGYGLADVERRGPITTETVFDLGSTSKQFTAAAIVLLAQDGRLSLDDDVRRHVPELPDYGATITIRQLLQHTSGLRDYIQLLTLAGYSTDDVTTDEDALAIVVRQRGLNFPPGTDQLYSNTGYFLLSLIVERVAGMPLRDFARTRLFAPLGMARTFVLHRTSDLVPNRAQAYARRDDGTLGLDLSRWEQTGDGAVWTTITDLSRWDANFYTGTVGGRSLLEHLQAPGTLADGRSLPTPYGLGLRIETHRGQRAVRHGGSWSGFRAELLRFPTLRTAVAVLCNVGSSEPTRLAERVADVVLARELSPHPVATPRPQSSPASSRTVPPAAVVPTGADALSAVAGRYRSPELDATWTLELRDGTLRARRRHASVTLQPVGPDTFGGDRMIVRVTRDERARVTGFTLDMGRVQGVRFDRLATDGLDSSPHPPIP